MEKLFFKELVTERLALRLLKTKDAYPLATIRSNKYVNRFIARAPTTTMPEALAFINKMNAAIEKGESLYWAVTQKPDDTLIGTICLWNHMPDDNSAEVGFELHPDFQQRGIMSEALSALVNFAFTDLKLSGLLAFTMNGNKPSVALLQKNGFAIDNSRTVNDEGHTAKYELLYVLRKEL